jgi:hypothetical protein
VASDTDDNVMHLLNTLAGTDEKTEILQKVFIAAFKTYVVFDHHYLRHHLRAGEKKNEDVDAVIKIIATIVRGCMQARRHSTKSCLC